MEYDASFGAWLTRRRQGLRLQRTELAARIGCAAITLRKIEADERRPSRQIAERLAVVLALPPTEHETFIRVARGELQVERLAAPQPAAEVPNQLPRPATLLSGRGHELAELQAMLRRPEVRLLTLTGAPGVGKSRLALELAGLAQGAFADGAFLVDFGPLGDPSLMLATIAQALQLGAAEEQALSERIGAFLRRRQILLVLDNLEHLIGAAPRLAQLLAAAPQLKLLATSRIALELSGEHRFTVLPLLAPPASERRATLTPAEAQERYPAVDLFVRRARAVAPEFTLSAALLPTVGEICRRLDGLPLAIELIAARANLFTPAELLAQLDDRFGLLVSRTRDLPERHLSLRHAVGWSYGLLAPAEQRLFRRLSVFVGGCGVEAARAVCDDSSAPGQPVVDGIAALVASSLLQRYAGEDGRSRFGMLETVHTYARSQLESSGELAAMRERHAAYYLALAETAERAWDQAEEWPLLRRLAAVRDNLRAALRWAHDTGNAPMALRMNSALFSFWTSCSSLREAARWIEAALAMPRPRPGTELDPVEAKLLVVAGYVKMALGAYAEASTSFARGQAAYQSLGDPRGIAWALRSRALIHRLSDDGVGAEQLIGESLALCREGGDAWGLAWSLFALADLRLVQGALDEAQAAFEDALVQLRQQGMVFGVVRALFASGLIHAEQGDLRRAEARYREGLALLQETPLLTLLTSGLEGLASVLVARGQPLHAARLLGAAEAMRESTDAFREQLTQRVYERTVAAGQAAVAPADWAASWAAGRGFSAAQALGEALETTVAG